MIDPDAVVRYAAEMVRLADAASLAEPISAREPGFTVEDAYAVSHAALRRREAAGWRRAGRKIGFANRTIWDQYGVYAPIFGYMYDSTVLWTHEAARDGHAEAHSYGQSEPNGNTGYGAELSLDGLAQPLIEPEIVFGLKSSPPVTDDPAVLLDAIEWVGHGFEVVQCHFPDWKFAIADTIADGGLHGRYVVGPRLALDGSDRARLVEELGSFRVTLLCDGAVAAEGGGDLVLGSPLKALAHFIGVLDGLPDHPRLEAGEIVTTGTLTTALPVAPGQAWSTRFEGLAMPGLRLKFT